MAKRLKRLASAKAYQTQFSRRQTTEPIITRLEARKRLKALNNENTKRKSEG